VNVEKELHLRSACRFDLNMPDIILPQIFSDHDEIRSGMSTRLGSPSRTGFEMNLSYHRGDDTRAVTNNREIFFSQIGIDTKWLAVPFQCHSTEVLRVDTPGEYQNYDALITDQKHVAVAVTVADCVPILLFDPVNKVIGAVHAGWKGTAHSIGMCAVSSMMKEYGTNPAKLLVFIGPSAGVCCYEVSEDVAVMFRNKIVSSDNNKVFIDLKQENSQNLQEAGVLAANIEISSYCTICDPVLFHSHRRNGSKAGRMMAAICLI
jgi:polyphenol oxidase